MLRIVATVFILITHLNFNILGKPTQVDLFSSPITTILRSFIEYAVVVGVNVFILISGWFGIKATIRGGVKLLFQSAFFLSLGIVYSLIQGNNIGFASILNVLTSYRLWFIPAYLGLYILSPALNTFIDKCDNKTLLAVIISFYVFQTFYGYFPPFLDTIGSGYSTFSFIGLYILSAYLRRVCPTHFKKKCGYLYLSMAMLNATLLISTLYFIPSKSWITNGYINPITIISSFSIMLWLSSFKLGHNKIINWISKSSFGVFLLHSALWGIYKGLIITINTQYAIPLRILLWSGVIIVFFIAGILLDKVRERIWQLLIRKFDFKFLNQPI